MINKKRIRFLALILMVATLCSMLAACATPSEPANGDPSDTTTDTTTVPDGPGSNDGTTSNSDSTSTDPTTSKPVVSTLAKEELSKYKIVRSLEYDADVYTAFTALKTALDTVFDIRMNAATDIVKQDGIPQDAYEILVGDTNRISTVNFAANEFQIGRAGNRIYILAATPALVKSAVEYFIANNITAEGITFSAMKAAYFINGEGDIKNVTEVVVTGDIIVGALNNDENSGGSNNNNNNTTPSTTNDLILRNMESAQYIYGAKQNFIKKDSNGKDVISESNSKMLICHISDMHADITRFNNSLEYAEYFGADFIIHTGDTTTWCMDDQYGNGHEYFKDAALKSDIPMYNTIGNHETFDLNGKLTNEYLHKELIDGLKNIVSPNGRGYYHVDFKDYKLRLIVMNPFDYDDMSDPQISSRRESYTISQAQCDWLVEILKDAAEKDYGVIIASHEADIDIAADQNDLGFCQRYEVFPWGGPSTHNHIVADIVDAFKDAKSINKTVTFGSGVTVTVNTSFEKQGEFICHLSGHRHGDFVGYLEEYPDQISITMPPSGCYPDGYHNIGEELSDLARIPGTVSEDCINFYTIDREKKTISIVRVGATVNDQLQKRIALQLSYDK